MPNIIEQQDLLKGLPDARLALLMQKPMGDIPPFLVAAEAQRRQSVRQQFAGDGSKESVVDSLTKQLSNVPQNLNAAPQTPPNIPPPLTPPTMQGIAGIPQGQPQQMAEGGVVEPMWRLPSDPTIIPRVMDWVGTKASDLYNYATTPWGETPPASESKPEEGDANVTQADMPGWRPAPGGNQNTDGGISSLLPNKKIATANPKTPQDPKSGKEGTSPENQYKAKEAEFRQRIESLYGSDDPSNWENAQKWFAMSQAIMQPGQNLMQSLAGAGAIYAGAEGEQAAQRREADQAREEMMLKYDMDLYSQEKAAAIDAANKRDEREFELKKAGMLHPDDAIGAYGKLIDGIDKQLENGLMMDPAQKDALLRQRQMYEQQLATIMHSGGYGGAGVISRDDLESQANSSYLGI